MDKKNAREIYDRYLSGRLTPEEEALVKQWLMLGSFPESSLSEEEVSSSIDTITARLDLDGKKMPTVKTVPLWKRVAVAAAVVMVVSLGIGIYRYASIPANQSSQFAADIVPGSNGATLTLASGRKIRLASAGNGELAKEAGITISKTAGGEIVYTVLDGGAKTGENPSAYNILSTANGETYSVVLPDGSRVWLNAASSLKYPTSFASLKERRVELAGEGYFEIAKSYAHGSQAHRVPFIVRTASQQVEVLGTHFNINAYTDEPDIRTTLLEGSVNVRLLSPPSSGQHGVRLRPGQQAINHLTATAPNPFTITEVDPQSAIDWKNGDFIFKTDDFKSIMRKIARWYDVEILYAPDAPTNLALGGLVSRSKNIAALLKIMEETGDVHFKVSDGIKGKGRRITVTR